MTEKVKGPASCFPSIETTHGRPIVHWLGLVRSRTDRTHMQIASWLKGTRGLGYGHANAVVAQVKAETTKKDKNA